MRHFRINEGVVDNAKLNGSVLHSTAAVMVVEKSQNPRATSRSFVERLIGRCVRFDGDPFLVLKARTTRNDMELTIRGLDGTEKVTTTTLPIDLGGDDLPNSDRENLLHRLERCPLCGTAAQEAQNCFEVDQLFWRVWVLRCSECGLVYKTEIPSQRLLSRMYGDQYVHFQQEPNLASLPPKPGRRTRRLGRPRGRYLDYGCGAGHTVADAYHAGWDAYGCDPFLPQIPNDHALAGRLMRLDVAESNSTDKLGSFDCISMWAVVEHLTKPYETFRGLTHILNSGGHLIFNCPNGGSHIARRHGRHWYMATLLEHVIFMTPRAVHWLAENLGLEVDSVRYCGSPYPFGTSRSGLAAQGLGQLPFPAIELTETTQPMIAAAAAEPRSGPSVLPQLVRWGSQLVQRSDGGGLTGRVLRHFLHWSRLGDHMEVVYRKRRN